MKNFFSLSNIIGESLPIFASSKLASFNGTKLTIMNDNQDVKNFCCINGMQNNITIIVGDNSTLHINANGNINLQAPTSDANTKSGNEKCKKSSLKKKYSGILNSPDAEVYWAKLRAAKIVDRNNQPLNLSWSQAAYLAYFLAEKLAIDDKWKEFGEYWNLDRAALKSNYYRGIEYSSLKEFNALLSGLFD